MYKTILFDFDGTLADTKEGILKAARYATEKFGYKNEPEEKLMKFIGPTLHQSFERLYGFDKSAQDLAVACYREYYMKKGIYEAHLYDGVENLLREIKKRNLTLAIASAKMESAVLQALEYFHILKYFDIVLGSLPNGERSGKAELIEDIAIRLGTEFTTDNAVFIGDSHTDCEGAHKAGCDFIAAVYDRDIREFANLNVKKYAYNVAELKNMLLG